MVFGDINDMSWLSLTATLTARSIRHPADAWNLLRVLWRFRRRGWYRRFPFLPIPSRTYVRWRMYTAYGSEAIAPPAEDLVRYARWATRHQ